jgi:hypothetical protein
MPQPYMPSVPSSPFEVIRSQSAGYFYSDTRFFDDLAFITTLGDLRNVRIVEINCIYGYAVVGLHVVYQVSGNLVSGPINYGTDASSRTDLSRGVLQLQRDDYITEVSGNSSHFLDRLFIRTAQGKTVSWGGGFAGQTFSLSIPTYKRVVGFSGGLGSCIQSISVSSL